MNEPKKPRTTEVHARLWGARARDWAEFQEPQVRSMYETVLARAGLKPGMAYLDAGCGSGLAAQIAAKLGARVSGIDAAGELLAIARERSPKGDFRAGDLEDLPYADNSFDVVTGFNSFQFAGNPAVALGAARRVTKPGGIAARAMENSSEAAVSAAHEKALAPFRQKNGGYRAKATFRCLLARP